MKNLLLVDLSYQAYRAAAAHPGLTSRRVFTGGLYGFFSSVSKAMRDTRATEAVFCLDSPPYLRSRDYPQYKQLRKEKEDSDLREMASSSKRLIAEALGAGGFPLWGVRGFESDDLVAHALRRYACRFDAVWAASNDSDLYQLAFGCASFRVYRRDLASAVDADSLARDMPGVDREGFLLAQALQGTHNDIEGVRGVGPKTAAKILADPAMLRAFRAAHGPLIERNLRLIRLPHPEFPRDERMPRTTRPDAREMWRFLTRYDIDVTSAIAAPFEEVASRAGSARRISAGG